jgi:hypothetical protein
MLRMPLVTSTPSAVTPALALALAGLTCSSTGCPAKVPTPETEAQAGRNPAGVPVTDDADPRVVRDSDDLYISEDAPRPPASGPALGSGRPDTTNGVCKLFSPKLPEPACCPFETGFDAERVKQLCGHALYMGESLHQSCGYYFLHDETGGFPVALRGSKLTGGDMAEVVGTHDLRMAKTTQNPDFKSTPVPGVEGAMWSEASGIHWAFVPGWSTVRMVSWTDDACSIDAMPEVLKLMAGAKEVPVHAPRPGLIPVARE